MSVPFDVFAYKQELLLLKKQIHEALKKYPEGILKRYCDHKNGKEYPAFRVYSKKNHSVKGITKDRKAICLYAEKDFLQKKEQLIDYNLEVVDSFMFPLEDLSVENIISKMNPDFLPYLFAEKYMQYDLPANPEAANRIVAWMRIPCPPSDYRQEELKHLTTAGFKVRSKSEVVLTEKLKELRLPFKYECPIYLSGRQFLPDFTVMRADGKFVFMEHCGLMTEEQYASNFWWKMKEYANHGICLWDNLILTFDNKDGSIDVKLIEAEIRSKIFISQ